VAVLTLHRAALLALLWVGVGISSCFAPRQPACAFSCAGDGKCPAGYSCSADDGWCHRDDAPDATCDPPQIDSGSGADTGGSGADAGGAG
jgi:hypothetical protein